MGCGCEKGLLPAVTVTNEVARTRDHRGRVRRRGFGLEGRGLLGSLLQKVSQPGFLWASAAPKVSVGSPSPRDRRPQPRLLRPPSLRFSCRPLHSRSCPRPRRVRSSALPSAGSVTPGTRWLAALNPASLCERCVADTQNPSERQPSE